ncbi:MAG: caspase family protein, partial [Kiritimatiellales bacterium]
EGYLIPQDGDEKDRENSISLTKLQQQMQNSKAGRKLLVLDACHSGSATRGVSGIAPSLKTAGVHVMASCAENELSHPDPDSKHGIFTRYLLEGVDGKADTDKNGSVTQKELFEYVQKSMMEWGLKTGKTQRPQMLSPTTEDIMISRVPGR